MEPTDDYEMFWEVKWQLEDGSWDSCEIPTDKMLVEVKFNDILDMILGDGCDRNPKGSFYVDDDDITMYFERYSPQEYSVYLYSGFATLKEE